MPPCMLHVAPLAAPGGQQCQHPLQRSAWRESFTATQAEVYQLPRCGGGITGPGGRSNVVQLNDAPLPSVVLCWQHHVDAAPMPTCGMIAQAAMQLGRA